MRILQAEKVLNVLDKTYKFFKNRSMQGGETLKNRKAVKCLFPQNLSKIMVICQKLLYLDEF